MKIKFHLNENSRVPWPFQHMSIKIIYCFWNFHFNNRVFLNIHYYHSQYFFYLEEIMFENCNISENNIISVELPKVLGYWMTLHGTWIKIELNWILIELNWIQIHWMKLEFYSIWISFNGFELNWFEFKNLNLRIWIQFD